MIVTRRSALAFLGLGASTMLLPSPSLAQRDGGFTSGARRIAVERFDALRRGRRGSVLLLHGSDGPTERYRSAAWEVARGGYHVFLPHYLDRTDERRASLGSIMRHFELWSETARDALDYASGQPGVEPSRIGILGVSLGGGLGIALAARDRRVRALVTYYGFVPSSVGADPHFPPTLILHGEADRGVPVGNARALEGILQARGVPHEVRIYPGQGHGFRGAAQADATIRIGSFFARTIGT